MKIHQDQGINTPQEMNQIDKISKEYPQNEQSNTKQLELDQMNKQQISRQIKEKNSKSFSSFVINKYSQMNNKDFKKIPISFIKQIYDNHSIDLRKVNKESIQTKLNFSHNPIDINKMQMGQQNYHFDIKNNMFNNNQINQSKANQYKHMVQSSYNYQGNQNMGRNKHSSDATKQFESFNSEMNQNISYLNSPLNFASNAESRSSSQKYDTRYNTDSDSVKQENNSYLEMPSNKSKKNNLSVQFSNYQYTDKQNLQKVIGQINTQNSQNKTQKIPIAKSLITSPSKYELGEMKVNSFNELNQLQSQNKQLPILPSMKGSNEQQKDITPVIENKDYFQSNSSKNIQYKQISHVKCKSDLIQNAFNDQVFSNLQNINKPAYQVNIVNKKQIQTNNQNLFNSVQLRQKTDQSEGNQKNGNNNIFKRTNSNNIRDETEQIQFKQSVQNYFFSGDFKNNSTRQTSFNQKPTLASINMSLSQRQNQQTIQKSNNNQSIKSLGNSVRFNTETEEDFDQRNNDISNYEQQLFTNKSQKMNGNTTKNQTQQINQEFEIIENKRNIINIGQQSPTAIENVKAFNNQNNSQKKIVGEKEKLINNQWRASQEQNTSNQNGLIRKSFRLTDISKSTVIQTTRQDQNNKQKTNELNSPLSCQNRIQQNILSPKIQINENSNKQQVDNPQQSEQEQKENNKSIGDYENKDLKILESKFVLHKPLNHTKNKEYIKNLQSYKNGPNAAQTNGEQSPFVRNNKKRLSLSFLQPHQLVDNQKRDQLQSLISPTSLCSTTKVKSLFAKNQSSYTNLSKIETEDLQLEKSKSRKSSNIFKGNEKESMHSSQKGKYETDEIKSSLVKQILTEQTNMYEEYQMSLEHKLFEKRRQENQINLKRSSNGPLQQQKEFNTPSNRSSKLMFQDLFSPSSPSNQNQFAKKHSDLSPSYSKDVVSPKGNKRLSNLNSPKTIAEKFSQEENLMIRRSSMRLSIKIPQSALNNIQISDFSEIIDKNKISDQNLQSSNSNNYNDLFNQGVNLETINSSQHKRKDLPTIAVQISNKSINEQSKPYISKRNSKLNQEQNLSKRNSIFIDDPSTTQFIVNDDNNMHGSINTGNIVHKQQASMFSKMISNQSNQLNKRPSNIVVTESQTSIKESNKNRNNSNSSQESIDSESSGHSRNSSVSDKNNNKDMKKSISMNTQNSSQKMNALSNIDVNNKKNNEIQSNQSIQSIANNLSQKQTQGYGFSESVKTFYDKQTDENINISQKDSHNNIQINQQSNILNNPIIAQGGTSTNIQSPRYSNTLILGPDQRKSDYYNKFQNSEQRKSNNSPRNQSSLMRIPLGPSDQSSKQKGFATISIELKEIMEPYIIMKVNESDKLNTLLIQYNIKKEELKSYYKLFLEYALIEDYQVFNMDLFAPFKIHHTIFEQLQILLIDTLKSLNYNTHAIEQIIEKLEGQKKVIQEGLLVNEIGGSSGVHKLIVESFDEINQKIPNSFAHNCNSEEKIAILTRVVTIICNFERKFNSNPNTYMNQIDQKSIQHTEIQPLLHHFQEFGQMEFYCLKLIFWTSLEQRGFRQQTIFRFLEQFEKARYKISSTLTMNNFLIDKQMYEELVQDYVWKIQCDQQLSSIFEDNNELILQFCHSNILEFLYNLKGRFNLHFLLTKLTQLTAAHLNKLKTFLTSIVQYREVNFVHIEDIQIKFFKLSCRLGLVQSPLSKLSQNLTFLQNLVREIDSIMHSDECFENFIQKFPEDRLSLTLGDQKQSSLAQSGLRALNFFLLTLLSDSDIYSIQDLRSLLQAFNISITIPIQWKIAIEFSLNNLKVPQSIAKELIDIISNQFSLLYKNTQYESFNKVLLN